MRVMTTRPQQLLLLLPLAILLLLLLLLRLLPSSTSYPPLLIFYDDVSTLAPAPSVPSSWEEEELVPVAKLGFPNISHSFHPRCNCSRQAPDIGNLQVRRVQTLMTGLTYLIEREVTWNPQLVTTLFNLLPISNSN